MSRAGSKDKLERFAQALAAGKTPVEAAKIAGYPKGKSFADNARKRSHRDDVKKRVAELQAPALAKVQAQIDLNADYLLRHCHEVIEAAKRLTVTADVSDGLSALDKAAKILGVYAPEKRDLNANVTVGSISNTIVDPKATPGHSDSESVQAALDAGTL